MSEHPAGSRLQAILEATVASYAYPLGVILRVETPGGAWQGAAGPADHTTGLPADPAMTFRIASNTKTFTAAMVLRLVEQGRLRLDDQVARYFEPTLVERLVVVDGVSHGHEITLRQLLNHTSGLYDWGVDPAYAQVGVDDPGHRWTPLEQVEWALSHGAPYGRPGEVHFYSDTGYVLAAMIVEQITALPLARAFRSVLPFAALGLKDTYLETLEPAPVPAAPRLHQYIGPRDVAAELDASFDLYGGGGFVSSLADLCRFWRALFGGEVFERSETLAAMLETVPAAERGEAGLGVFRRSVGGKLIWCHGGFWGSFVIYEPAADLTAAVCLNQQRAYAELMPGLVERVIAATTGPS